MKKQDQKEMMNLINQIPPINVRFMKHGFIPFGFLISEPIENIKFLIIYLPFIIITIKN